MNIKQIYTGCLAQGTYIITSQKEAAIVDPLREIEPYVEYLKKEGLSLKYIFETHFHADFVSGHIDLAAATGATIVYGPTAEPAFPCHVATHGEIFRLGNTSIEALHTPGHTLESTTYLLRDTSDNPYAIFSGDTVFIGDVGRPDLAQKAANMTQEELAALLYTSLREHIMTLPDSVLVYPAHGAGSACGKHMSDEKVSTIGEQKKTNYALRADMTQEEFITEVLDGLESPPQYFGMNVAMNKSGYTNVDTVIHNGLKPLDPKQFEHTVRTTEAMVLDTRDAEDFAKGHISGSITIGLEGMFAPWVGALIGDVTQPIALVCTPGTEKEAVTRLARVGFDAVVGYLDGGITSWIQDNRKIETIERIDAKNLSQEKESSLIDVRRTNEFSVGHMKGAVHVALDSINEHMDTFSPHGSYILYCAGGYRSMIAASILKARGIKNVRDVIGGFTAIQRNQQINEKVCPV